LFMVLTDRIFVSMADVPILSWVFGACAIVLFIVAWPTERRN